MMTDKIIKIFVEGGIVSDVLNVPPDWDYEIIDLDEEE